MNACTWIRTTFVCCSLLLAVVSARADERILDLHSEIIVAADGSLDVTETIKVRSEGDAIRHGIFRDFPTRYEDQIGNNVVVDFKLLDARRDDNAETARVESMDNGVRIYLGDPVQNLDPGNHAYVLHYRATRELGFFADHDELFWNASGNGWDFPIDHASAHVQLPVPTPQAQLQALAYTGAQGERGMAWQASIDAPGEASFTTTAGLQPHTGLSIVLMFPKGVVAEPTLWTRLGWLLSDNAVVLIGVVGLGALWLYFMLVWRAVGRDLRPGVIIAQYEPPPGLSPAAMRYIQRMGYDDRCFAADVVAMGVSGFLIIGRDDGGKSATWTLSRPADASPPPADESQRVLGLGLLPTAGSSIELKDTQATIIRAARSAHQASLKSRCEKHYFVTNAATLVPGFAWTLFMGLVMFGFASRGGFVLGLVLLAMMVATDLLFMRLMKAQTPSGRRQLDLIDGLKLYLGVAERDELHALQLPSASRPALDVGRYQQLLPFALALGVEEAWTRQFTLAVGVAAAAQAAQSVGWYANGAGMPMNFTDMSHSIGSSLSSAISSSATPPGSDSGGGGSSGDGGGGGGGGGW